MSIEWRRQEVIFILRFEWHSSEVGNWDRDRDLKLNLQSCLAHGNHLGSSSLLVDIVIF